MSVNETVWRSLHDVGLAAWFGGNLFGVAALENGSDDAISGGAAEPDIAPERVEAESWKNWTPLLAGAISAHLVGGLGLVVGNRARIKHQSGVGTSTAIKATLTAVALGLSIQSARDGSRLDALRRSRRDDGKSEAEIQLERRVKLTGPLLPAITGAIIVLGAVEGEQQRPREMARGLLSSVANAVTEHTPLGRVA